MKGLKQNGFERAVTVAGLVAVLAAFVGIVTNHFAWWTGPVTMFGLTLTWVSILHYSRRLGQPHGVAYACIVGGLILTLLQVLLLALDRLVVWLAVLAAGLMIATLFVGVAMWGKRFRFGPGQAAPPAVVHV